MKPPVIRGIRPACRRGLPVGGSLGTTIGEIAAGASVVVDCIGLIHSFGGLARRNAGRLFRWGSIRFQRGTILRHDSPAFFLSSQPAAAVVQVMTTDNGWPNAVMTPLLDDYLMLTHFPRNFGGPAQIPLGLDLRDVGRRMAEYDLGTFEPVTLPNLSTR